MSVTIKDVAKEAGVSPSTVSRVLSDNSKISEDTKNRVMDVISRMNYHPNVIARNLANQSTRTLGLILPSNEETLFKNPFFIQIMTGISIYAQKKGYYIMYSFSNDEKEELNFIKNFINSKIADGIILLTSRSNDKCINYLKKFKYPFVVVGRPENTEEILWVDNDNSISMYMVVESLIHKGHKSIAFIGGPKELNMSRDRLEGYTKAITDKGLKVEPKLVYQEADFTEETGYAAITEILKFQRPTAIVTTDDLLAFGVIKYFNENKIEDIAVVGFNNIPLSQYQKPALSSVDINAEMLGYHAAKLLISSLNEEIMDTNHFVIDTKLVERESSLFHL